MTLWPFTRVLTLSKSIVVMAWSVPAGNVTNATLPAANCDTGSIDVMPTYRRCGLTNLLARRPSAPVATTVTRWKDCVKAKPMEEKLTVTNTSRTRPSGGPSHQRL